ncbi:MAG: hypothetical protein K9J17_14925 [Flavobacteriales bacterium]|nr:hypothetical protein [Flavobacteriales bacterium]
MKKSMLMLVLGLCGSVAFAQQADAGQPNGQGKMIATKGGKQAHELVVFRAVAETTNAAATESNKPMMKAVSKDSNSAVQPKTKEK